MQYCVIVDWLPREVTPGHLYDPCVDTLALYTIVELSHFTLHISSQCFEVAQISIYFPTERVRYDCSKGGADSNA